ncbi:MAG: hypothetical protein OXC95_03665 [Dehalococcoidia bacterium]|nr:hypothetical protein [Dehalococcoidia bacterium]
MAVSNFPFTKTVTVGDSAFPNSRWLGFNGAELSLDLDAADDQRRVIGTIAHGVRAKTPTAAQRAADPSGRRSNPDRDVGAVVIPGTKVSLEAASDIDYGEPVTSDGEGKVIAQKGAGGGKRRLGIALETVKSGRYVTIYRL